MSDEKQVVMVVDDEPAMCRILERLLKGEGYDVLVARNGDKALELYQHHKPDLVLPGIADLLPQLQALPPNG